MKIQSYLTAAVMNLKRLAKLADVGPGEGLSRALVGPIAAFWQDVKMTGRILRNSGCMLQFPVR